MHQTVFVIKLNDFLAETKNKRRDRTTVVKI